jgi:pentose-5-phosphate-3-epimerase
MADMGARRVAFHRRCCASLSFALDVVQQHDMHASLSIEVSEPLVGNDIPPHECLDRYVVMGSALGKPPQPDDVIVSQLDEVLRERQRTAVQREAWVDGGIRRRNLRVLRDHGADGIVIGGMLREFPTAEEALRWVTSGALD